MTPEIISSIIGTFVTAIASIIVALIQANKEKRKYDQAILLPSNVVIRRPKIQLQWQVILFSAFLGGILGFSMAKLTYANSPTAKSSIPEITLTPITTGESKPVGSSTSTPIEISTIFLFAFGIAIFFIILILVAAYHQGREISLFGLIGISKPKMNGSRTLKNLKRDLHVFLCHSSDDSFTVEKFYNFLIRDGIDAWLDKKTLIPGQKWEIEIPKAVKKSDVVIVFLSSKSVTKEGFVQKEIKIALDTADEKPDGTIFIIPARLEDCEIPERLAKFHWVNLFEKDGYEFLFKALRTRADSLDIEINKRKASVFSK
jgi:hypothetical protein